MVNQSFNFIFNLMPFEQLNVVILLLVHLQFQSFIQDDNLIIQRNRSNKWQTHTVNSKWVSVHSTESPPLLRCRLSNSFLSDSHCQVIASALEFDPSNLRELNLSQSELLCSGMERLCAGLKSPNCRLEVLRSVPGSCWWTVRVNWSTVTQRPMEVDIHKNI